MSTSDSGNCPVCGGESDGSVLYTLPRQTRCLDCGKQWSYGEGVEVLTEEESRKRRPELWGELIERKPLEVRGKLFFYKEFELPDEIDG